MSTENTKEATVKMDCSTLDPQVKGREFPIRQAEKMLAHQRKRKRDDWKLSEDQNLTVNENGSIVPGATPGKSKKGTE